MLTGKKGEGGELLPNEALQTFDEAVTNNIQGQECPQDADATTLHTHMNKAIHQAIEDTLPDVQKSQGTSRKVSERSKQLYEKREKLQKDNQAQYDELQQEIKESRLQDFKEWVEEHSQNMQAVNGQGDVKKIYKSVNALSDERKSPPNNLITNGQGNMLTSAQEVANRWFTFLTSKFVVTER